MGRPMLSKSLIQFFVDGWSCVPSLSFTWDQTMVEIMQIMVTSFKRSHACTATLSAPSPAAGHHQPTPLLETPGHSQPSLGQSLTAELYKGFSGGTSGKEPICQFKRHKRQWFDPWVGKIPWRRAWQPTLVFLPGESHGQNNLVNSRP